MEKQEVKQYNYGMLPQVNIINHLQDIRRRFTVLISVLMELQLQVAVMTRLYVFGIQIQGK